MLPSSNTKQRWRKQTGRSQRRITRVEKTCGRPSSTRSSTKDSGGLQDLLGRQQGQDQSRSSNCKDRESIRQDQQEALFRCPPCVQQSSSIGLDDGLHYVPNLPRPISPRHSTQDRHGEDSTENDGRNLSLIQDDAYDEQEEDSFDSRGLGIDNAESTTHQTTNAHLGSVPPEDTISIGTEEVDQDPTPLMSPTSPISGYTPTSPFEVDQTEQQPDVLPVPQNSVLEEADTPVGSSRQAWLNVQQLMPTLPRPKRRLRILRQCNTDDTEG